MRRLFLTIAMALAALVMLPGPAWADEGLPPLFSSWSPSAEWQPIRFGAESLLGDGRCSGGWRSWGRDDGVTVVLKAYACSADDMGVAAEASAAIRARREPEWQDVPSVLSGDADFAGPSGESAHYRSWIEGGYVVHVIVQCPDRTAPVNECLAVSNDIVREVSAVIPGEPQPAPRIPCCATPRSSRQAQAAEALETWEPSGVLPGSWETQPARLIWGDAFTRQFCESSSRGWGGDGGLHLTVQWWICDDTEEAVDTARRAAVDPIGQGRWSTVPPALGPHRDVLHTLSEPLNGHARTWAQGDVAVVVIVQCGNAPDDQCATVSADTVRSLSEQLPGEVASTDTTRLFVWNGLILGVLLVGGVNALIRGTVRIFGWVGRPEPSEHPRWHDVWSKAFDAMWQAGALTRARWMVLAYLGAIIAGVLAFADVIEMATWVSVVLVVAGLWLLRRARRRVRQARTEVIEAMWRWRYRLPVVRLTGRRVLGLVVVVMAALMTTLVVVGWVGGAWIYAGGGAGSPRTADVLRPFEALGLPVGAIMPFVLFAVAVAESSVWFKGSALLLGLGYATVVFRYGRRLLARTDSELRAVDDRPSLLLLRNFDDDRILVPPSRLAYRNMISSAVALLTYPRRGRFQEILVRQLTEIGPVEALVRPRTLVPQLGAARATVGNDWKQTVREKAAKARAVVFLAAPESIGENLAWELAFVATEMPHKRVILVIPPDVPDPTFLQRLKTGRFFTLNRGELLRRWNAFRQFTAQWELFRPLSEPWIPRGVHVLAYHPTEGWHAWGCGARSEWTYAAAIHEVCRFVEDAWSGSAKQDFMSK